MDVTEDLIAIFAAERSGWLVTFNMPLQSGL